MSKRRRARKVKKTEQLPEDIPETAPQIENEVESPTPQPEVFAMGLDPEGERIFEKPKENTVVINIPIKVWCPICNKYQKPSEIAIDQNGVILYELYCGHKQAFAYKLELLGIRAINQFGRD